MALVWDNRAQVRRWLDSHSADSSNHPPTSQETSGLHETGFLTSFYAKCVKGLRIISQQSSETDGVDHNSRRYLRQAYEKLLLLEDAFLTNKIESSLGNHEHLRKAIARSLHEIGKLLVRDLDAIRESSEKCSHAELVSDLENYIEKAKNVVAQDASDTDSTGSSSSSDDDAGQKPMRAGKRLGTFEIKLVARHVDLLLQLCPSIEQVYEHKHMTQLSGSRDVPVLHVSKASDSYASAVQAKFPSANQSLVQRLGEANWERHQRLRNLEKTAPLVTLESAERDLPSKSQFQPVSLFRDSALGSSMAPRSQSAASAASHSSFASSKEGAEKVRFRVPNLPKGISFGESFECPFCKKFLSSIRFRIDWKMHVFADLQSYVCVHNHCPDILTTFPSRKAWFEHEKTCHLSHQTICCPQCDTSYEKENDFLDHCERQHNMTLRNPQLRLSALANATVSYLTKPSSIQCALCKRCGFASLRDYSTHLGRELEEVSLYPLPHLDDSDEQNEDDSENEKAFQQQPPPPPPPPPPNTFTQNQQLRPNSPLMQMKMTPENNEAINRLAQQLAATTTPEQRRKIQENLQRLPAEQLRNMKARGVNPMAVFFRERATKEWRRQQQPAAANPNFTTDMQMNPAAQAQRQTPAAQVQRQGQTPANLSGGPRQQEPSGREIALDIERTTPSPHPPASFSSDNWEKKAELQDYISPLRPHSEEEYMIKCICGFTNDTSNDVYCPTCDTWQHIECYYLSKKVPEDHHCSDCVPNDKLDAKKAHERQIRLREAPSVQKIGRKSRSIYSATYSNVSVYQLEIGEEYVMRRRSDDWVNATHILKIARVSQSARTRILEREVHTGIHEEVTWGDEKFQGTWMPLDDARALAEKHGVFDKIMEIFVIFHPGNGSTPTPELLRSQVGEGDINHTDTQPRRSSSPASLNSGRANALRRAAPEDRFQIDLNSFWSVRERRQFPQLVGYYGRDFSAIANHMKAKTKTMLSDHYHLEIALGNTGLKELAEDVDRRRDAGEPLGPPPDPLPSIIAKPGWFDAGEYYRDPLSNPSPPLYPPPSPSWQNAGEPHDPLSKPSSPRYSPSSLVWPNEGEPHDSLPNPPSPNYSPVSPHYSPTSPVWQYEAGPQVYLSNPASPHYSPTSPVWQYEEGPHALLSNPASPSYSPVSPVWQNEGEPPVPPPDPSSQLQGMHEAALAPPPGSPEAIDEYPAF